MQLASSYGPPAACGRLTLLPGSYRSRHKQLGQILAALIVSSKTN